ncbi:MAG: hypothetical protein PVJ60_02805 [Phycisphaerales bacterium]|jgi:hypothetical protein
MASKARPKNNVWMMRCYYISTYILALIAILGFCFSISSSRRVAETLDFVQKELSIFTMPLIEITDFTWVNDSNEPISRANPPVGLLVTFKNASNVAIKLTASSITVYYGEKKLDDVTRTVGGEGTLIMMPGEESHVGTIQGALFPRYLKNRKGIFESPNLNIHFKATFSRLQGMDIYEYSAVKEIGFNPDRPGIKRIQTNEEVLKRIK